MIGTYELTNEEVRNALMEYLATNGMIEADPTLVDAAQMEYETNMADTETSVTIRIDFGK